jgi:predicted nucleic acid-binding protein
MRVVDTSAWIEWFAGSATGQALRAAFPDRTTQIVPTIVQFELAVWAARELSDAEADVLIADSHECVVVDLDSRIALRAAEIRRLHRLPTADAIVYATALERGADVLTCDAHFEGLPNVVYVPKKGS